MPRPKNVYAEPIPEPTLAERHNLASRTAEAAVGLFTQAAMQLEASADSLDLVSAEADSIAQAHAERALAAANEAEANRDRATKIRNLFA